MKKKYTVKFFKNSLPEWKRKKDPPLSRIFYRPVSFFSASILANRGVSANTVSYFSILIAVVSCLLIIIPNRICNILGAIFVNIWLISDCTDGNMARSVKKQPFGDFADSASSYILTALLCVSLGVAAYFNKGILFENGCILLVLLGALAGISDALMRLIYQKYKACERSLADEGKLEIEKDQRSDITQTNSLLVRIEADFGIGGIIPLLVLLGTIFNFIDLLVIYCFLYYFLSSVVMIGKYICKAIKNTKMIEEKKV